MSAFDNNIKIVITNGDCDSTLALWAIKEKFTDVIHIVDPTTLYTKFKNKNLIIINVELSDEIIDELLENGNHVTIIGHGYDLGHSHDNLICISDTNKSSALQAFEYINPEASEYDVPLIINVNDDTVLHRNNIAYKSKELMAAILYKNIIDHRDLTKISAFVDNCNEYGRDCILSYVSIGEQILKYKLTK
jgi:hypothetical protein